MMSDKREKCLIIGSGPAGYTAAIYTSRANLAPILYEGLAPGGQLTTTTVIENFPGFSEGIDSFALMDQMKQQAAKFGTDVRSGVVTELDLSKRPFRAKTDEGLDLFSDAIIIATGATAKYLGLPSETKYMGRGVSGCATCDGFLYRGKRVAVVGGGDTACESALYLSGMCENVYLIVRKDHLRASKVMQKRVEKGENIEIVFEHNLVEVLGNDSGVTGAVLANLESKTVEIALDGIFMAIGHHPNTELVAGQIALDEWGYIKTEKGSTRTSIKGVFAAGDIQDPIYRQAVTAAASGCKAAIDCENYLITLED